MKHKLSEFWPFDRRGTHALLAFSAILGAFIFIVNLKAIFTPFFIALIIAYILNPFVNFFEFIGCPRWLSTTFVFILLSLCMVLTSLIVVPSVIQEFKELTNDNEVVRQLPKTISTRIQNWGESFLSPEVMESIRGYLREWTQAMQSSSNIIEEALPKFWERAWQQVGTFTGLLFDLILIPFYLFFLLNSLNKIWNIGSTQLMPYEYRDVIMRIFEKVHISMSAFFRGRLMICLMIGLMCWIGFKVLGVPFPSVFGFCIGFATIVPLLGLIFLFPALLLFVLSGADLSSVMIAIGIYTVLQSLEMFVFTPVILGKEVELPPLVLVMSILICGYLFGGLGVVLAVPIASTAKILFHEFIFPSFVELSKKNSNSPRVIQKKERDTL
jgi:predicted PurR-regulated permease PerM